MFWGYLEKRAGAARKAYRSYVEKGIALGKRPELTGGGLIRSLGGWDDVKKRRLSLWGTSLWGTDEPLGDVHKIITSCDRIVQS